MSRIKRSTDELEAIRREIMGQALELIVAEGYEGFSMRKLAARLGIAAKTIYNFFRDKDELYIAVLSQGFEQLLAHHESAVEHLVEPVERLRAAIRSFVEFGLEQANVYNIMFTWNVPKYYDYVGTEMEPAARLELDTAMKYTESLSGCIAACASPSLAVSETAIRHELILVWSAMHGFVAGVNNTLLLYLTSDPASLKDLVVDRVTRNTVRALSLLEKERS